MKTTLLLTATLFASLLTSILAGAAHASNLPMPAKVPRAEIAGQYSRPHLIGFLSYRDQAACEGDQGKWDGDADGGVCMMEASDDVTVTTAKSPGHAGQYDLQISTVTTNAHMCDFTEPARLIGADVLQAKQKNDDGMCIVTATFKKDRSAVSISTSGSCQYNCGMNASLDIDQALRK